MLIQTEEISLTVFKSFTNLAVLHVVVFEEEELRARQLQPGQIALGCGSWGEMPYEAHISFVGKLERSTRGHGHQQLQTSDRPSSHTMTSPLFENAGITEAGVVAASLWTSTRGVACNEREEVSDGPPYDSDQPVQNGIVGLQKLGDALLQLVIWVRCQQKIANK